MDKFRIRVYNKVKGNFDPLIYETGDESIIAEPDAILVRSEKLKDKPILINLLAIARAGAGTDNIPINICSQMGIVVFNTPGANANAVKELVIWAILSSSRNVIPALNWLKQIKDSGLEYEAVKKQIEDEKKQFQGNEIAGKTVFIIGLGAIGSLVADALAKLDMRVIGYDPYLKTGQALKLPKNTRLVENLNDGIKFADFITIHTELTKETSNLLTAEHLRLVKPNCKIINFARAEIIDQSALMIKLNDKKISGYISDFISPHDLLLKLDNVFFLPHLGAATFESEENCATMAVTQLRDFLENGNVVNSKNFPNLIKDWESDNRLVIANENIPGQIAAIGDLLKQAGQNIVGMLNSSREELAYTVIDLNLPPSRELLEKISGLPGILKVRPIVR